MNSLEDHCFSQIESIFRPVSGALKHPYLVPGGLFHGELWDWDSFWIAKGMCSIRNRMPEPLQNRFLEHAMGSWKNFFENQSAAGIVPIMIKTDNPDFFGCANENRIEKNQAKPIFGQFALEISRAVGGYSWAEPYFDRLLLFYRRWISRYRIGALLVWGSDVAIGVDCDPTTYGRPSFSSANLLLNCLFYSDLIAAAEIARALGRNSDRDQLLAESETVKSGILGECWDASDGFFYTVDVQCEDHRDRLLPGLSKGMRMTWKTLPLKVKMFTGFLPMWCGIASVEQARLLVRHLANDAEFNATWGLRSLAKSERMYVT